MNDATSPQEAIEASMDHFREESRWEAIYLYSSEGLPLAASGHSAIYSEDTLLEFVFSMMGTVELLEGEPIQEMTIRGSEGRRMVFRYLTAWDEPAVLVAVAYARKGFRRAMTQLIRLIQSLT